MEDIFKKMYDVLNKYTMVLSQVLKVDIDIVDYNLNRIAGTGRYKDTIDVNISEEGFIYRKVIETSVIENHLRSGKVVVVAGFQGTTLNGEITTLGRGGSDTAAVAIGGYLKAERVDIFTDVPGIAKVDPRIVPAAPYLKSVSYDDMYKLAYHGAKVIHPRAVMTAQRFNVPVRVRSTFSDDLGTLISEEATKKNHKIIGMALEKEVEVKDSVEPTGRLYMVFDDTKKEEIERDMQSFLMESGSNVKDIVWDTNNVSIFLPTNRLVEAAQGLFNCLHN